MALSRIDSLENLLASLTISQPQNPFEYKFIIAVQKTLGKVNTNHATIYYPEYRIWYRDDYGYKLEFLMKQLQDELKQKSHPHNESIVKSILAAYCLEPERRCQPIHYLNKILESIVDIDLSQIFIFPFSLDEFSCNFGSFTIQNFDGEAFNKLKYRCKKAGCDYFDRYKNELRGQLAIQRKFYTVKIVQYWKDLIAKKLIYGSNWGYDGNSDNYNIIHNYFEQISNDYANNFWITFGKEQHLLTAAGAYLFDERRIKELHSGTFLSIFLKSKGDSYGYGVPLTKGILSINILGADKEIQRFKDELKSDFTIDIDHDTLNSSLPHIIQKYIFFIGKAKRSFLDEEFDESFLYFVIALDLVLGEDRSSTQSVSERVAIITFKKLANDFSKQKKKIKDIYNARSKYVHEGGNISNDLLNDVEIICKEVFFCMLRYRNYLHNEEDLKKWWKKIDFLAKAIDAEEYQSDQKFKELGIWAG